MRSRARQGMLRQRQRGLLLRWCSWKKGEDAIRVLRGRSVVEGGHRGVEGVKQHHTGEEESEEESSMHS